MKVTRTADLLCFQIVSHLIHMISHLTASIFFKTIPTQPIYLLIGCTSLEQTSNRLLEEKDTYIYSLSRNTLFHLTLCFYSRSTWLPFRARRGHTSSTANCLAGWGRGSALGNIEKWRAHSLQWWTTTKRPQRRPDFRRRRRTRPVATVGHRADHFLRLIHRAPSTCIVQAPQPQQPPQPRILQSPATSRPQLVRSPLRPRSLRSPYPVPRSTTVP